LDVDRTGAGVGPIDVGTVVHVNMIVGCMTNIVPWVELGVVGHTARSGAVGVGAVDKIVAVDVA